MDKEQLEKKIEVDANGQKCWTNYAAIKAEYEWRKKGRERVLEGFYIMLKNLLHE